MKHLLLSFLIVFIFLEIEAQQNRYECLNQNFVENEIKGMRFGHFFNLELKKGENRNKQSVDNYRQQALFFQNKANEAYDKCFKLPACTKNVMPPSFNSKDECIQYLRSLEDKKSNIEREFRELDRKAGQLQSNHQYTELIPIKKKINLLIAEKLCIKEQIKACNCGFVPSEGNSNYEPSNTDYYTNADFDLSGNGWGIKVFQELNQSTGNSISQTINNQYTPVGFSSSDYSNQFIFLEGNILGISNWSLETYTDVYSLQEGITNYMNSGYVPMGISFTDSDQLHVLYIQSQLSASAWQLVESEMDLDVVSNDVHPYIYENYVPVGITVYGGMYYTLLIQLQNSEPPNWTIEGYEDNTYTVSQGINQMASQGLVPFGYLNEQGVVNVLFVGF